MSISAYMSKDLLMVDMDDELSKVKSIFEQHPIHHLIVTENNKLVGVLTDRDLYKHLSPNLGTAKETHTDISQAHKKVHLIMTREPVSASEDISLTEAALKFYDHHLSCLPIVDSNNIPIGILTWHDIIALFAKQYRQKHAQ
jgi:acetoin utilization protein AcuB